MRGLLTLGFIFIVFASQAVWVTFSPVLTLASQDLNVSVELLGLLAVTYPVFFLILTIPSGLLLDRDFKKWFLFGSLMTFFAASGRLLSFNYWWLLVCQLSGALGQPFLLNAFVPYSSQLYGERRAAVISALSLSMYLGTVFALATGLKLYTLGGLDMLILPAAAMSILGILLVLISIRGVEFRRAEEFEFRQFGSVLKRKDLWILGAILGFGVATFDNLATWLQPALRSVGLERVAGDAVAIAIVMGLLGVAMIPQRIAKRNLRTIYMRAITPLIALFFVILIFAINDIVLFAFLGISGFLMLPAYAIIMDWIGKFCKGEVHGSATGFVGLTSRAISVALTLGAMYFIGSAELYFSYLTVPITIAFILTLLLPNDLRISQSQSAQQ
ncbi:MFS transporter [Archaeoglobus neptunius]|uniref:MFS transporter n=1 Tax=Archaeoglobus neptunius TaxID=2798580 RepID=UPI001E352B85|nr:MFS transporter [Archaeoglobus neptunius]